MKPISAMAKNVHASTTLAIDSMYKEMKAKGLDVVGFGAGEPDFPTPSHIVEAAVRALHEGKTKYTPASGLPELKAAVCDRMKEDCHISYTPANVLIASGAKHNLFIAFSVLLDPGDEVILPAPYWVSYAEMIAMCGGVPVVVRADEAQRFKITPEQLEAAITPRTKCLCLNSPSNPSGMIYSREELLALAEVCVRHDLYIISDEIYYCLVYDGNKAVSMATLGEEIKQRTLVINGVSKAYSMTGWRIGYTMANEELTRAMSNFVSHSTGAPATFAQWGAVEALRGPQDQTEVMRQAFEQRRNLIVERINAISGVSCLKPEGAFYVMMNLRQLIGQELYGVKIKNADDFAGVFLDRGHVAVVPCTGFAAPEFVRLSYAVGVDTINAGMDRLEAFLKNA